MSERPFFLQGRETTRKVTLPSRAFFSSWQRQTLPARRAALAESEDYFGDVAKHGDAASRDMALAALIADAMQPLEDIAHLGRAWEEPFGGLATYVRATVYSSRTATNFWGGVAKRSDEELKVFAGLWGRDPQSGEVGAMLTSEIEADLSERHREAITAAETATVSSLRRVLGALGEDWRQFSPYYNSFKHGGLLVNREDVLAVEDEVEEVDEQTRRHQPSIAVWTLRGEDGAGRADFDNTPEQVATSVASSGRLALRVLERFIESRATIFEALTFAADGSVAEMRELTLPFTIWLNDEELSDEDWKTLGRGPRIRWISEDEEAA